MAAASDSVEVVGMLLSRGAEVNATDSQLMTPLQYAAIFGNLKMCQFLLDQVVYTRRICSVNERLVMLYSN